MLSSGDWLIPHYLDTPFLVKPPLAAWLVATVSRVPPKDHALAMPVTDFRAAAVGGRGHHHGADHPAAGTKPF